jgi:hypothetical protein
MMTKRNDDGSLLALGAVAVVSAVAAVTKGRGSFSRSGLIHLTDDIALTISDLRDLAAEAGYAGDTETQAAALVVAGLDLDTPHLQAHAPTSAAEAERIVVEAYRSARAAAAE